MASSIDTSLAERRYCGDDSLLELSLPGADRLSVDASPGMGG
jgi:hypothetical protein